MNNDFNKNRLRFARKRRGFTIKKLASLVEMTPKIISDYENRKCNPPPKTVSLLAKVLSFPESFFQLDDIADLDKKAVSFRSFSKMTASTRDMALTVGQIALEFTFYIDSKFNLPKINIPDLRNLDSEIAASTVRDMWALGELSISNMIHLLESKGVRIFSIGENLPNMDAYSFWMDKTPFVFVNNTKTVERDRFDMAHELGHLILHKHGSPLGREVEIEANRFASAFLMPSGSVLSRAVPFPTLNALIKLKPNWQVSVAALIRRLFDLNLISEWHYRSFMVELSSKWGRKNEPDPIKKRELSKLLPMIFSELKKDGIKRDDIAKELNIYTSDLNSILYNLTLVGVNGRGTANSNISLKNHLKLVKS